MAKLVSFMLSTLSQNIANSDGKITQQLTGPVIVLRPKFIPSEYSFAITIGINDMDSSEQNSVRMTLRSPSGRMMVDSGDTLLPAPPEDAILPQPLQGFVLSWALQNAVFEETGTYQLEITYNGEQMDVRDVPVYPLGLKE